MVRTVFKTVGRRLRRLRWVRSPHAPAIAILLVISAIRLEAQVPLPVAPQRDTLRARDTIPVPLFRQHPPVSPGGALLRSMLVPGWGQAVLGRRVTGAVFVFWEGLTIGMTAKAVRRLNYLETIGDTATARDKRREVQDWAVLLVFNHVVAGLEAFVSANLWDFPVEAEFRALPGGAVGFGARVRRRRYRSHTAREGPPGPTMA